MALKTPLSTENPAPAPKTPEDPTFKMYGNRANRVVVTAILVMMGIVLFLMYCFRSQEGDDLKRKPLSAPFGRDKL